MPVFRGQVGIGSQSSKVGLRLTFERGDLSQLHLRRPFLLDLSHQDLIGLARAILREHAPTTEDEILASLRRIESRL